MSTLNQNGLLITPFTTNDYHPRVSQGTVVGIVLGWIFGALGLYFLGLLLIWKCCKTRTDEDQSRVSNSVDEKGKANTVPTQGGRHRKQMFEENPTLQMVNVTESNQVDSRDINLNFNRINPKRYRDNENDDRMRRQDGQQEDNNQEEDHQNKDQ